MFLYKNMDIKDGVTTTSKEQSLVRVYELDEIAPKGGKDRTVTKEHPQNRTSCKENIHL
jgi:hypothetical protein